MSKFMRAYEHIEKALFEIGEVHRFWSDLKSILYSLRDVMTEEERKHLDMRTEREEVEK